MREENEQYKKVTKISSGIAGLDGITEGGLPAGRSTLVSGSSGSGKTILSLQFLFNGIRDYNQNGVFVTCEETPADIRKNCKSFGWDVKGLEDQGKLAFVDISPVPDRDVIISGKYDFSAFMLRLENAVKTVKAQRVVIDSIGALLAQFPDTSAIRTELFRISATLKGMGITTIITAERISEYGEVARFGVEEFVADNVIILRNILYEEKVRRTIQILKFRGATHQRGEFPFTITNAGIEVMALSSMKLTMESSDIRISSGNKELDTMCGGGFFRDSIILVSGATGTGKTLLVTSFMHEGCSNGSKTLIFAFEESRQQLLRNAIGWNMDFRKWEDEGLLKIICDYPEVIGLTDHLLTIKQAIDEFKPDRIAIDSLSVLERVSTGKSFREFVVGLTSFIKERETAGLFTAVTPSLMGGSSVTEQHISTITDSIILLRYVEIMSAMHRGVTVLKMRGSWHDKDIRKYSIDDHGIHIGKAFKNVSGIMAGAPSQLITNEVAQMEQMFET